MKEKLNKIINIYKNYKPTKKECFLFFFIPLIVSTIAIMLWGNHAHKKGKNIDRSKHLVLTSGHPSPMSANQGKWFGNKHFSQTNAYLIKQGKSLIDWQLI